MSDTRWNGEPCEARRCRVVVADDPRFPLYWARVENLIGQERDAVEVTYCGHTFYLDDDDGQGWHKVTHGGGPQLGHSDLSIECVVAYHDEDPR